jgi:hypothetical protein
MRFIYSVFRHGFKVRIAIHQLARLVDKSGSLVQREQWMMVRDKKRSRFESGGGALLIIESSHQFQERSLLYYLLVSALYPDQFLGATPPRDFMYLMRI